MKTEDCWIFLAYKTEKEYPENPYFAKVFFDHEEMKMFSADHSYEEKSNHPGYVSTYCKTTL